MTLGGTSLGRARKAASETIKRAAPSPARAQKVPAAQQFTAGEGARRLQLRGAEGGDRQDAAEPLVFRRASSPPNCQREEAAKPRRRKMGLSAYGISADLDDPLVQAIHKLFDHSAEPGCARLNDNTCAALEKRGVDCSSLWPKCGREAIDKLLDAD